MNNKTNAITEKIVELRELGKHQLNAEHMGGVGCKLWDEYNKVASLLAVSAWDHVMGLSINEDVVDTAISGLMSFFGVNVTDLKKYRARILCALIQYKGVKHDDLKQAIKDKNAAKKAWDKAIEDDKSEEEIATLKATYEENKQYVTDLYDVPGMYRIDPTPMFNKKTLAITSDGRKRLEDTFADIYIERKFMTAEEIRAEKIALDDERKGRSIRKKKEEKAEVQRAVMDELQERGEKVEG